MATNYYLVGMIIGVILLLAIIIWFILRWIKKRKQNKLLLDAKTGLPLDVINDFNEAERRLKENKENGNPYKILWEIARERGSKSGNKSAIFSTTGTPIGTPSSSTTIGDIQGDREPERRQDIQIQSDINPTEDKRKPKRNWAKFN